MNADILRYRALIAAAVGAGVVIGAAGVFLYHQLFAEKRRILLQRELARLDVSVAEIRNELDALRTARLRRITARHANSASPNDEHVESDMYSTADTDEGDEQFYDFSDEDDMLASVDERQKLESDPKLVQLLEEVDRLLKGTPEDKLTAYSLLQENKEEYQNHVSVLWRLAKASHMLGQYYAHEGNKDKKKEYIMQGFHCAQQAVEMDESDPEAHKWFAITVGSRGEFQGIRERIEDGFVFKQHLDKALILRPEDPSLHHLTGRFKYEVATLTWFERKVAATLFTEPPNATYADAVEDFFKAEELSSAPWKENRLLLAKCYINLNNFTEAIKWLNLASQVPVVTPEDEAAEKEVQTLLIKYGAH